MEVVGIVKAVDGLSVNKCQCGFWNQAIIPFITGYYYVACGRCARASLPRKTEQEAIDDWNKQNAQK